MDREQNFLGLGQTTIQWQWIYHKTQVLQGHLQPLLRLLIFSAIFCSSRSMVAKFSSSFSCENTESVLHIINTGKCFVPWKGEEGPLPGPWAEGVLTAVQLTLGRLAKFPALDWTEAGESMKILIRRAGPNYSLITPLPSGGLLPCHSCRCCPWEVPQQARCAARAQLHSRREQEKLYAANSLLRWLVNIN